MSTNIRNCYLAGALVLSVLGVNSSSESEIPRSPDLSSRHRCGRLLLQQATVRNRLRCLRERTPIRRQRDARATGRLPQSSTEASANAPAGHRQSEQHSVASPFSTASAPVSQCGLDATVADKSESHPACTFPCAAPDRRRLPAALRPGSGTRRSRRSRRHAPESRYQRISHPQRRRAYVPRYDELAWHRRSLGRAPTR